MFKKEWDEDYPVIKGGYVIYVICMYIYRYVYIHYIAGYNKKAMSLIKWKGLKLPF